MIIDIHGHYTTEPPALHTFRDKQLAGLADSARKPTSTDLGISDEVLVKSVQPQLKFQTERGGDLTIFSPRAGGMAHRRSFRLPDQIQPNCAGPAHRAGCGIAHSVRR